MQWTLTGDSASDASLAKAMLDGFLDAQKPQVTNADVIAARGNSELNATITPGAKVPEEPPVINDVREHQDGHTYAPGELEFTKEQINEAAEHLPELARLIAPKKGRRSIAIQTRINELTSAFVNDRTVEADPGERVPASDPMPEPIGKVLEGMSAAALAEALAAPSPPTRKYASAMEEDGAREEEASRIAFEASRETSLPSFLNTGTITAEALQSVTVEFSDLSDAELDQRIQEHATGQGGVGLAWYRNVVKQGGGELGKMPREHMLKVLANPDEFYNA